MAVLMSRFFLKLVYFWSIKYSRKKISYVDVEEQDIFAYAHKIRIDGQLDMNIEQLKIHNIYRPICSDDIKDI